MKSYEETRFVFKCPKCDRHNEYSLEAIKKANLQFRCAFEACCTRLTYYQYAGCVTYEAEGRVHLPASRVRLERR
jgi:hypothetical protein